jgi:hypothetical protein
MGKDSQRTAGSSRENSFGSCETHTNNLSGRQKKNRSRYTCTLGEVQGGEEEGGIELRTWAEI